MNKKLIRWSQRELQILQRWYPIEGATVKKRLKRRTKAAINAKAHELGLYRSANTRRLFSLEEELLIAENYAEQGTKIAKKLNRAQSSVSTIAYKYNLKAPNTFHDFTEEECNLFKSVQSLDKLCELLPRHTRNSIIRKRIELGYAEKKCIRWTKEEITVLKKWYPIEGTKVKSKLKNRTVEAITQKAKKLKISYRK